MHLGSSPVQEVRCSRDLQMCISRWGMAAEYDQGHVYSFGGLESSPSLLSYGYSPPPPPPPTWRRCACCPGLSASSPGTSSSLGGGRCAEPEAGTPSSEYIGRRFLVVVFFSSTAPSVFSLQRQSFTCYIERYGRCLTLSYSSEGSPALAVFRPQIAFSAFLPSWWAALPSDNISGRSSQRWRNPLMI